ncbi:MerR family DNA-binding transcriptional regulator [Alloalcanivorax xenomutans]|uniref:MerR family DNA-binding transcriptional regulator n=1 Tax=Alloalcanivorax xenomutans TaxID=1094342 RepID=UPI001C544474
MRFYERIGLLKTVSRKANGYRTYPPNERDVDLVELSGGSYEAPAMHGRDHAMAAP